MKWIAITLLPALLLIVAVPAPLLSADCAEDSHAPTIEQVLESPGEYIGWEIEIEGILDSVGTGKDITYTVRTDSGVSLQVRSWAPEGDGRSRYPSKLPDDIKPMSCFIGRKLGIIGKLVQERSGKVVLEASSVEVLDESSD